MVRAVLIILFASFMPAVACTPKLDVMVTAEYQPPVVRSTYDVDAIRALAVSAGQSSRHGALGFYMAAVGYQAEVGWGTFAATKCPVVTAVVRLSLGPHLIEIARDLEARGCRREVVLSHFILHTQYDMQVMEDYVTRTLATFKAGAEAHLLGDPSRGDAHSVATDAIKRVMNEVTQSISKKLEERMAAVDDKGELTRLSAACTHAL